MGPKNGGLWENGVETLGLVSRPPKGTSLRGTASFDVFCVKIGARVSAVAFSRTKTRNSAIAEGPRDASCQLKSCQLPRNSAETTYTTNPDQIDGIKLEI